MLQRKVSRSVSRENEPQSPAKYVAKLEEEFHVGESLGKGGYGQIIKARRKCDDNQFAIKIIKYKSDSEDFEKIRREAKYLSEMNHSNIVRYFNSWTETARIPKSEYDKFKSDSEESLSSEISKLSGEGCLSNRKEDENENKLDNEEKNYQISDRKNKNSSCVALQADFVEINYLFIQMELCEKRTLRTDIDDNLYLEENKISKYFKQICKGLSYIHSNKIVHRDLNPKNIFLTANDVIKIGDFGLSKQIDNELDSIQYDGWPYASLSATCGTSYYIAPEIRSGNRFNIKADIYSLGVTYFEMCSAPMTEFEKIVTFPISLARWKTITFANNACNKKNLLKNLLQENHKERPTCDEILKILNSDTSFDELRNVIQQNRKVSEDERKSFEATLKSTSFEKEELRNTFLNIAQKIFELHRGRSLTMPTFIPAFNDRSGYLTTLLRESGHFSSVSNTSRIAFCHYVVSNKINKIRRYSIGKVFEEGFHSPTEIQECLFQSIGPELGDNVADAEMLFIGETICNEANLSKEVYFIINHGCIFWNILKHCKIPREEAAVFMHDNITSEMLRGLALSDEIQSFLLKMKNSYSIHLAKRLMKQAVRNNKNVTFAPIHMGNIKKAFSKLTVIVDNARKFGITAKIFVSPLLLNQAHSNGFMFKMMHQDQVLAIGGRFHSLLQTCRRKNRMNIEAVDISFNVDNVLKLFNPTVRSSRDVKYVIILAEDKTAAILLYRHLLSKQINCEIMNKLIINHCNEMPLVLIRLHAEYSCTVYRVEENEYPYAWKLTEMFRGDWNERNYFSLILSSALSRSSSSSLRQITY